MLEVGSKAPDFTLKNQNGAPVRLYDLLKEKSVVLYFYPKDETRGCTTEACSFRDLYEDFKQAGAEVVGISSDSVASHQAFAQNHKLPFILLADEGGAVRKLFDVKKALFFIDGRSTFVIDRNGVVKYAFNSMMKPLEHVQNTLAVLKDS